MNLLKAFFGFSCVIGVFCSKKFIVKLKPHVDLWEHLQQENIWLSSVTDTIEIGKDDFKAYIVEDIDPSFDHPDIEYIEEDSEAVISACQPKSQWHLTRVSERNLIPGRNYYPYIDNACDGINMYILDQGAETTHPEFEGRLSFGATFVPNNNIQPGPHGTHVASLMMGKTFGVCKKAKGYSVHVLHPNTGSGAFSDILKGMQFVATHQVKGKKVINMSISGKGRIQAVDDAIKALYNANIMVVVAAGNSNDDAANYSPAFSNAALVIGAIDNRDQKAGFSNFGGNVNLHCPGVNILAATINGRTTTMSGTSMASPICAAVCSLLWSQQPNLNAVQMKDVCIRSSTLGVLKGLTGVTPNRLAFTNPPNQACQTFMNRFLLRDYEQNIFA